MSSLKKELIEIFGEILGPVRLHWEGDDSEPSAYQNLGDALDEMADQARKSGYTAYEIAKIAYIATESEYQTEQTEQ